MSGVNVHTGWAGIPGRNVMNQKEQVVRVLTLINEHGGYERVERILRGHKKNMEYRSNRQRDINRDAKLYRLEHPNR